MMTLLRLLCVAGFGAVAISGSQAASANGVDPVLGFKSAVSQSIRSCTASASQAKIETCGDAIEAIKALREEYRSKFKYRDNQTWADAYVQQKYGCLRIVIAQSEFKAAGNVLGQPTCEQFRLAQQHFANIPPIADEKEWFGKADYDLRELADKVSAKCAETVADPIAE
jgi:hypothetical protein